MGGTGGSLGFANVCVSAAEHGRQRRSRARLRQPVRRRERRSRLGPRGLPRRRLHASNHSHFESARHLVRRLDRQGADRLARPLARQVRLAGQPAAGGLDRRLAQQADPHLDGTRVRAPEPARRALRPARRRSSDGRSDAGDADARRGPGRVHQRPSPAVAERVRHHGRHGEPARNPHEHGCGRRLPAELRPLVAAPDGCGPARRGSRHAHRDDRLGRLRHARKPACLAGSPAEGPVPLARSVQGRPRCTRHREPGADARLLRVRTAGRLERLRRHRSRRRRDDAGLGLRREGRARRRVPHAPDDRRHIVGT